MKLILPFLLISISVFCQKQSCNSFIHNIGGTDFDEVYSIFLDNDKNLITAGVFHNELKWNGKAQFSAKGKTDLFVLKSNIQGGKIWSVQLGSTGNDWIYSIKSDSLNNIFIVGQTAVKNLDVGFITKLDVDGNIIWKYKHDSSSEFFDILQTANKTFCSGTINGKASIITLNKKGVKINEFHFPGEGIIRGFSLGDKSSFYVFGINNQNALIAKLSSELKIQTKSTLSKLGPAIILSLIADEIGIIAGGQILNYQSNFKNKIGKEDAFVTSLSHDLKIKNTVVNGSKEKDWTRSICRVNKGQYVISTIANKNSTIFDLDIKNSKGNYDISLSLVDEHLNLISHKTIESALEEGVNSLQFSAGNIYMGGWFQGSLLINDTLSIKDNKNGNGFVVKCDLKDLFK